MLRKNYFKPAVILALVAVSGACNEAKSEIKEKTEVTILEEVSKIEEEATANSDSLISAANELRAKIEGELSESVKIMTTGLKAKIKQKWSEIHFYHENEQVVRIKTYPHATVSNRTEEFYMKNGSLVLVVVEDDGKGERGKSVEEIDKLYYFNNGKMIGEVSAEKESEYSIREGDAEELLSEFKEYMDIYANR